MKKCVLYKKEGKFVRCIACAHKCLISEGKTGICGVRQNIKGKLYLLVYGKVVARNIDPIEKKPLYHFLPGSYAYSIGTVGCNYKCFFCQNYDISQLKKIVGSDIKPTEIVKEALKHNCKTIAYTYNEPVIFAEFVKDIAKIAKKKHIKNILVTNGYMSKECLDFLCPYINAMNIDLKAFTDEFYKRNCGAKLQPVLDTIKLAHKKKIWIEVTTLIVPGENDSKKELEKIAKFIASVDMNIPWHISRFYPHYKMAHKTTTEITFLKEAEKIGKKYLNFVYVGNVDEKNNTVCPKCHTVLIEREGYFIKNKIKGTKCPKCQFMIPGVLV